VSDDPHLPPPAFGTPAARRQGHHDVAVGNLFAVAVEGFTARILSNYQRDDLRSKEEVEYSRYLALASSRCVPVATVIVSPMPCNRHGNARSSGQEEP